MPIAISDEQLALQASIRDWAKRADTLALVRRLEPGPAPGSAPAEWEECWHAVAGLGVFSIALPTEVGGAGGSVADLAAAIEQLTCVLAPGPVMPTALASLVLTGAASAAWLADGMLLVNGAAGPVLGGGATSHLLLPAATADGEVWFLLAAGHPGVQVVDRQPVDFSRPLADIRLAEVIVAPGEVFSGRVRDLAAILYATEAAAVAGYCCDTAAAYAPTRHQFGRPIGSFQAIKHLCAGMLCRAERAAALAWDAARAADEAPDEHPLAAVGVAHRQSVAETALTLCRPEGAASDGAAAGAVHKFLLSRCLSIAGGASQILLSMVAERALGLPREDLGGLRPR